MIEKILIFGNGQIGNFYNDYFKTVGWEVKISDADITKKDEVQNSIEKFKPTVVINTAAMTNLEWCNENRLEAFNVNTLGADNVAKECDKQHIYFIHFSSGCIFQSIDKFDAKVETDTPNPAAFYSFTKVWSEDLVKFNKSKDFKYLILRPRQPISSKFHNKNMLVKMLTFTKFVDTPNTLTVVEDLLDWTKVLIEQRKTGIYHVANDGYTTPYNIALLLKKYILKELPTELISKQDLDKMLPNKRVDTVLDVNKLKSVKDIVVKTCDERLEEIVQMLALNIKSMPKNELEKVLLTTVSESKQRTVVNEAWKDLLT